MFQIKSQTGKSHWRVFGAWSWDKSQVAQTFHSCFLPVANSHLNCDLKTCGSLCFGYEITAVMWTLPCTRKPEEHWTSQTAPGKLWWSDVLKRLKQTHSQYLGACAALKIKSLIKMIFCFFSFYFFNFCFSTTGKTWFGILVRLKSHFISIFVSKIIVNSFFMCVV